MGGDIGPVQLGEDLLGCLGVAVRRAADKAETGQVDDGINRRLAVLHHQRFDGRTLVETTRKRRNDVQATALQRADDAVVMVAVLAQHIGAQHQHADGADSVLFPRQIGQVFRHALRQIGVINADFRIFLRRFHLGLAAQTLAWAIGITIDQCLDHLKGVVVAASQPILQGEEIGAHILRGAGHELQQLGQAAQHGQLGGAAVRRALLGGAAQLLQPAQRPLGRRIHAIIAHPRHLHDVGLAHQAYHRVAFLAARGERVLDHADLLIKEQHGDDDDIGARDVGARGVQLAVLVPIGSGMETDGDRQAHFLETHARPVDRARQMVIERDNHDMAMIRPILFRWRGISAHNGILPRTAYRG